MIRAIYVFSLFAVSCLYFLAAPHYPGRWLEYLAFSVAANGLLFAGFRRRALYFDAFIGIFLWLGFWLKMSLRLVLAGGAFSEPVGAFDGSPASFDGVMQVATLAFCALLAASFLRERVFSYPDQPPACDRAGLFLFYRRYRWWVLAALFGVVAVISITNIWLGVYQRGMVSETRLPFGLNGVFTWALQFGLASFVALVVRFELELEERLSAVAILAPVIEGFMTNTAMLSRGMVLNGMAHGLGGLRTMLARGLPLGVWRIAAASAVFCVFFMVSVLAVNYLRIAKFNPGEAGLDSQTTTVTQSLTTPLFIDRWVGIEGLMAVVSSDAQGWDLWREAWRERFQPGTPSLYDSKLIVSPYVDPGIDRTRNHFVSLPGLIAFLYYPGTLAFLFAGLVMAAWLAALLEVLAFRYCGGNWVLCSLFAQVIAFRYASFGYVPGQSYLLFGALVLNGVILHAADRVCSCLDGGRSASRSAAHRTLERRHET
ncbi:hypothetical protein G3580_04665 [Nitrogeniibacter mangrovi]|uniref:Oligosaccharide repeat unit polymerase n=1 Tax=Nitrogeniibacter mangrovi TaxID=2016596 RepID=A0A6C1B270_9RHOO|nr:hypothetical protein [Nitrogeniibacter mangrovi]QID16995.1 hypothetical protein G3580_04665 [Nitrogeniibacter mangrovi]